MVRQTFALHPLQCGVGVVVLLIVVVIEIVVVVISVVINVVFIGTLETGKWGTNKRNRKKVLYLEIGIEIEIDIKHFISKSRGEKKER